MSSKERIQSHEGIRTSDGKALHAREFLTEAAEKAGTMLEHAVEGVKEHSTEMRDAVATYVRKKPFTSLGGALVAGAIIALLLRR